MAWICRVHSSSYISNVPTSATIKIEENMNEPSSRNPKSIGETVYSKFSYVLTIILSQGIYMKLLRLPTNKLYWYYLFL